MRKFSILCILATLLVTTGAAGQNSETFTGKPFFRNFSAAEYSGHSRSFDVICDNTGKVYVGNFEGLLIWDGISWEMYHTPGISRITALYLDEEKRIWFGGHNVFGYIDDNDTPCYLSSDKDSTLVFGEVSDIFTENGDISFIADGESYHVLGDLVEPCEELASRNSTSTVFDGMYVNKSLNIKSLGIVALATASNGLVMTDNSGKTIFTLDTGDGLCNNSVNSLAYDDKGSLWGVTDNGIFQISISSAFSQYGETDGLFGRVNAILDNGKGLYAGTLQGLFRLDDSGSFKRIEEISLACWNLAGDSEGNVMAATVNGVFRITPDVVQLTNRHTLCILPEKDGSFISGEVDGIYQYSKDGAEKCLLSVPNVCKLEQESDGGVWAINYYGDTYYMSPGSAQFEPSNGNMSLLLDYTTPDGRRWTPRDGGKGLTADEMSDTEKEWCRLLSDYSIDAMNATDNAAWLGGKFGLIRANFELMNTLNTFKPTLYVRSFSVDGNDLSFKVSMDKTDPMGTPLYSYKLHSNDNWSRWNENQEMEFNNLAAGKYQVSVRCMDSFGNIAETEAREFKIKAPFYLRWYAFLLYAFIISALSYATMQYRLYKAAKEKERLEAIVDERTRELKDAQNRLISQEREATVGKLTKGLIDRILNPMNYINNFTLLTKGLVKDVKQDIDDDKEKMSPDIYDDLLDISDMMNQNLEKIEQHGMATTRILKAMEALLKEHSGKLEPTDMEQMCEQDINVMRTYAKESIEKSGISISMNAREKGITANVDAANMSKVIASILSNAIYAVNKKAQKITDGSYKPEVTLTLSRKETGDGCVIAINDNGIGIEESIMDKIFDPFFTTKPTSEAPGVGLYLSQQIVAYANGTIDAKSVKDEYTTITITLP